MKRYVVSCTQYLNLKENEEIRSAAFNLFGSLYRFGKSGSAAEAFYEQLHNTIPSIVLHINDDSTIVKNV